jgi:hypothetical protein
LVVSDEESHESSGSDAAHQKGNLFNVSTDSFSSASIGTGATGAIGEFDQFVVDSSLQKAPEIENSMPTAAEVLRGIDKALETPATVESSPVVLARTAHVGSVSSVLQTIPGYAEKPLASIARSVSAWEQFASDPVAGRTNPSLPSNVLLPNIGARQPHVTAAPSNPPAPANLPVLTTPPANVATPTHVHQANSATSPNIAAVPYRPPPATVPRAAVHSQHVPRYQLARKTVGPISPTPAQSPVPAQIDSYLDLGLQTSVLMHNLNNVISSFKVPQLKSVLAGLGLPRTLRKKELQIRCLSHAAESRNNLEDVCRFANQVQTAALSAQRYVPPPVTTYTPNGLGHSSVPRVPNVPSGPSPFPQSAVRFKEPSPFYQSVKVLFGPNTYDKMSSYIQLTYVMDPETRQLLKDNRDKYEVLLMFSISNLATTGLPVSYPLSFKISVNTAVIQPKEFIGSHKKPWSSQPIKLTPLLQPASPNRIYIEFYGHNNVHHLSRYQDCRCCS